MRLWKGSHGPDLVEVYGALWILLALFWRGLACPQYCSCNSTRIWCTLMDKGIAAFPVLEDSSLAENITDIYIANQRSLASINDDDVKIYTGLRNLTVVDSGLQIVSRQAFSKNPKLTYINFSKNKLTSLPKKLFRHLTLSQLFLGGNPFQCSCDLMWVKVLLETNSLNQNQNIYCFNDNKKKIPLFTMHIPNCGLPIVNVSTLNITVLEGNETTLFCDANGLPDPNVSWDISQIISKSLKETTKRPALLTLKNVTSMDNKRVIVCVAENSVGEDQVSVELNVHFPPVITFIDLPTLDHHWCIPFSVRGNPKPTLQWFHEGSMLSETDFIWSKIHETSNNTSEHHGCLQLDSPTHLNNGFYTLRAENKYGRDERSISALFMERPDDGNDPITDPGFYDYETTSNDIGGTSTDIGTGVTSTDVSKEGNEDSITVYVVVGIAALVCTGLVIMLIILKFGRHSKFGLKGFVLFHSVSLDG